MNRIASILLLICFAALGTGAMEYLHDLQHESEDAAQAALDKAAGLPERPHAPHDETNCDFHAQLHVPLISAGCVPLLILLGLFVAFLTQIAPRLDAQRVLLRVDCRGPPAAWSSR